MYQNNVVLTICRVTHLLQITGASPPFTMLSKNPRRCLEVYSTGKKTVFWSESILSERRKNVFLKVYFRTNYRGWEKKLPK